MLMNLLHTPIEQMGREGRGTITCKVPGYWTNTPISVEISRVDVGHWAATMTHSSGGRDDKDVADDLIAEAYFGMALLEMSSFARDFLTKYEDNLETMYYAKLLEDKRKSDRQEVAK